MIIISRFESLSRLKFCDLQFNKNQFSSVNTLQTSLIIISFIKTIKLIRCELMWHLIWLSTQSIDLNLKWGNIAYNRIFSKILVFYSFIYLFFLQNRETRVFSYKTILRYELNELFTQKLFNITLSLNEIFY